MDTQYTKLRDLVKAILTRVQEKDGYTNKTKLFKYLYLIDIDHYSHTGELLTGFQWVFHLYGPWSQDCEKLYSELRRSGEIHVTPGNRPDFDTEFLKSSEPVDLDEITDRFDLSLAVRRIVDTWSDKRLGEMLDYVYFHTEPMEGAEKGRPLEFSKIERISVAQSTIAFGTQAPNKTKAIKHMRQNIADKKARLSTAGRATFTPFTYDEEYFEALRIMEEDDGY